MYPKNVIDLKRYLKWASTSVLIVVLLVSCKSAKMLSGGSSERLAGEEQLEAVIANTPVFDSFSSRLRMTLPIKKNDLTVNGTLKMERDRLIQISLLMPIIRTEVARVEISPEHILVIDRMNKRYAQVPVSDLRNVLHTEVDFPMLQSLFTNTIFLPGKSKLTKKDYASFEAMLYDDEKIQLTRASSEFLYSFQTSLETNRLVGSAIEMQSSLYCLLWEYENFAPVGETTFPTEMTVLIGKKENPLRTTMELSRLSVEKETLTPTAVPARYEQIGLEDIVKILSR